MGYNGAMNVWKCFYADGHWHVIPLDDLRPHSATEACWCKPRILNGMDDYMLDDDDYVCVHNALDRREQTELLTYKPN